MNQLCINELKQLLVDKNEILDSIIKLDLDFLGSCNQNKFGFEELDAYISSSEIIREALEEKSLKEEEILSQIKNESDMASVSSFFDNDKNDIKKLIAESNEKIAKTIDLEKRCKEKTDEFLSSSKGKLGDDRRSTSAAMNYFKIQNNLGIDDSQFDDKK